jgi:hypothetical protein
MFKQGGLGTPHTFNFPIESIYSPTKLQENSFIFWGIMLCSLLNGSKALFATCFMLVSLLFDSEDGGDMFLWNVS